MLSRIFFSVLFVLSSLFVFGQDRYEVLDQRLKNLSTDVPGLNEKVELSVNGVSIQEFIRGIGNSNNININVDPALNMKVVNNFSDVTIREVFIFLCKNYNLDINFIGSILSFVTYNPGMAPPPKIVSRQINVSYKKTGDLLSYDLSNDSLLSVAKEIAKISKKNIVLAPELNNKFVNGFIQDMLFQTALEKLALSNDLKVTASGDNTYLIEKKESENSAPKGGKNDKQSRTGGNSGGQKLNLVVSKDSLISLDAENAPISDIIEAVSNELKFNYFLFSEPKGNTTLSITKAKYEDFLKYLLNGTDYTFKKDSGIYLIGDRGLEGLRATKVIQLKYRSAEKIIDFIPADAKKGVEIKLFPDLNSIILSGSQPRISEVEDFLISVDKVVPVVMIEVLIVDVRNTRTVSTGIKAGLKDKPTTTGGTVFPTVEMNLSANSINSLIDGINGFGVINLGKVTPNFYMELTALEEQGLLTLHSTPKLSTLNGHEAKMSIGRTEYYLEESTNIIGTQNPQSVFTHQYKPVNADLSVAINPMVSGDEQITLDIKVKQSNFTERISANAPPGAISRDFSSLIRVKNDEMVILGGLEENSTNNVGSGIPFLARIPIIKWLFSKQTRTKSKSKLTIFIKPTIIF